LSYEINAFEKRLAERLEQRLAKCLAERLAKYVSNCLAESRRFSALYYSLKNNNETLFK